VHDTLIAAATAALTGPGLVVITGPPGSGRSTTLQAVTTATARPAHTGGGLAVLATVPALALSRAVRARLPTTDPALLAEAVRSRVRGGLLVLDDLQHCDPATLAALPAIAAHCRVLAALRTPHRLGDTADTLHAAATAWLAVPPLDATAATELARRAAPHLDDAALTAVVTRAGGNPLAVDTLARHAAAGRGTPGTDVDQVAYAVAAALADLPRPARTAMAALGLLGRPTTADLLGPGAGTLVDTGLAVTHPDGTLTAVSGYLADLAAGLLDPASRTDLHRRLAALTPPHEGAHHLAAAGDHPGAYRLALQAADTPHPDTDRAALLLFACDLPGVTVHPRVRIAAADAALTAGRPTAAARVLTTGTPLGVDADVLRGEAHLQAGNPHAARAAVQPVPDAAPPAVVAARDRILLLADLATDPHAAAETAAKLTARHPAPPPGIAAALAAVAAHHRTPGWDTALTHATTTGDPLTARWSAWLLVEHLTADGRLTDAATTAHTAAAACADDLAYTWQTRFLAAAHWATALHGGTDSPGDTGTGERDPHRRAADLLDRTLPDDARGYATAATALLEADTGLLATARARLTTTLTHPATDWVTREAAWLDGQPDHRPPPDTGPPLLTGLHHITARWAAHDTAHGPAAPPIPAGLPACARHTLTAWATGTGFTTAADTWHPIATREQVRCLIAAGLHHTDPTHAVPALLTAEDLATRTGLVVLAGRARRALRRHHVRRDTRSPRSGTELTHRERDVLHLVAAGEPTRRIAGQLGISTETVDTHIRAAMRKLGARTRTEAAARATATHTTTAAPPVTGEHR
jgi:DNA-binding CsgD family transcriptional regulator